MLGKIKICVNFISFEFFALSHFQHFYLTYFYLFFANILKKLIYLISNIHQRAMTHQFGGSQSILGIF